MNAARRGNKRTSWPRGLREPRPGYYTWEEPGGKVHVIGRVPLASAKAEALAANLYLDQHRPTLVDRLTGGGQTVADIMAKMPEPKAVNTAKSIRSLDKKIAAAIGKIGAGRLTTRDCSAIIEAAIEEDKARTAVALRSRLIAICNRGQQLGWMTSNPALPTTKPKAKVNRARLTLEAFRAIYAKASEVSEWLPIAMRIAMVTGADRATIAAMTRADIQGDALIVMRSKTENSTGLKVAIPLDIRLEVLGWTLRDVLAHRTNVVSRYFVHHVTPYGNAPVGSPIFPDRITKAFTEARRLAGIPDVMEDGKDAPTFHEMRSLCKRLYEEQGNVDTKALLGHASEKTAAIYADPRGSAPIRVRIVAR